MSILTASTRTALRRLETTATQFEVVLPDEEGVVLRLEWILRFEKGQGHPVGGLDVEERADGDGLAEAEEV